MRVKSHPKQMTTTICNLRFIVAKYHNFPHQLCSISNVFLFVYLNCFPPPIMIFLEFHLISQIVYGLFRPTNWDLKCIFYIWTVLQIAWLWFYNIDSIDSLHFFCVCDFLHLIWFFSYVARALSLVLSTNGTVYSCFGHASTKSSRSKTTWSLLCLL